MTTSAWCATSPAMGPSEAAEVAFVRTTRLRCEARIQQLGDRLAARIAETFLGITARATRDAGLEAFIFVRRQNGRVWNRMYMGGGCVVTHYGPKPDPGGTPPKHRADLVAR